ncbi:hypothetical protein Cpir12675_004441 [Ceratocystis pirilliformis]|uniref:Uncharacterized protein n=1 Tax=Ceratocystis pirilliformis TaxID=259994 RepID=A0ABR3YXS1_9PEZI
MAREDAMGDATEASPEQNPKTPLEDVEMGAADTETGPEDDATLQTTGANIAASPDNTAQELHNNKAQKESVALPQSIKNNATDTDKAPMHENTKPGDPKTEKERNLATVQNHLEREMKQAMRRGEALIWLAEKIPEVCNEAVTMAKGDASVKKLAGHVAAKGDGGKGKNVVLKKTTPNKKPLAPTPRNEERVRVFIRGPSKPANQETGSAIATALGETLEELELKKVNSGWAFYTKKSAATAERLNKVKEACGAKACEQERQWTHARITGLADYFVAGNDGLRTTKNEEWFTGQIAEKTGGQVMSIKWQFETEKFMDATLKVAIDLPEGQKLPDNITFEGSTMASTVKKCRNPLLPLCRTCWELHPTSRCKEKARCRLCGHTAHGEKEHAGPAKPCLTCKETGHAAGDTACKRGIRLRETSAKLTAASRADTEHDGHARKRKRLASVERSPNEVGTRTVQLRKE